MDAGNRHSSDAFDHAFIFGHSLDIPKVTLEMMSELKSKLQAFTQEAIRIHNKAASGNAMHEHMLHGEPATARDIKSDRSFIKQFSKEGFSEGIQYLEDKIPDRMQDYLDRLSRLGEDESELDFRIKEDLYMFTKNYEGLLIMYKSFLFIDELTRRLFNRNNSQDSHQPDSLYKESIRGLEDLLSFHDARCRGLLDPAIKTRMDKQTNDGVLLLAKKEFLMARTLLDQIFNEQEISNAASAAKYIFSETFMPLSIIPRKQDYSERN